jgi:hypothetical protein
LQHLAEIYTDTTAQKILREIDDLQSANPGSPIWEGVLVDKIVERTALIDLADRAGLSHIQSQRHLSAHPVIRNGVELHRPNKDDVRAMMRNALESVLTKFPLVSRRVMEQMLEDLAETQQLLPDENSLKKYLESKYFSRFHSGVAAAVFRSLWKLVFRTENESCDANRSINFRALKLLVARENGQVAQWITDDPTYYSSLSSSEGVLSLLVKFLSRNGPLYAKLEQHAKTSIEQYVAGNPTAMLYSGFLYSTRSDYFEAMCFAMKNCVGPCIDHVVWAEITLLADDADWQSLVRKIANIYYSESGGFDTADQRFKQAVANNLDKYTLEDVLNLVELSSANDQCYLRWRASVDHRAVKEHVLKLDADFDFSPYPRYVDF